MPNHVANYLIITGEQIELKRFLSDITNGTQSNEDFKYENIFPIPDTEKENCYYWCLENWGNKWGCYRVNIKDLKLEQGYIKLYYDTAWNKSDNFWIYTTNKYIIKVKNYYHDEGSWFCGFHIYEHGEIISKKYYNDVSKNIYKFVKYATKCGREFFYKDFDYEST